MEPRRCVLVLGSGPAGLSAALWLKNLGLDPLVAESADRPGGLQNLNFLANDWVLGQQDQTGPELVGRFVAHATEAGVRLLTNCAVRRIEGRFGAFRAELSEMGAQTSLVDCSAVLLATGTRYRATEVLDQVRGIDGVSPARVLYGPWAFAHQEREAGARVLVVGGGDNAFENARLLLRRNALVIMALRSPPRAQQALLDAVLGHPNCTLLQPATLKALSEDLVGLTATLDTSTGVRNIALDRVHVLAGYEANSAVVADLLAPELAAAIRLDDAGYLAVDACGRTGAAGIYAAGDVCNPRFPSVVSALAQGALAAKTIELDLRQP